MTFHKTFLSMQIFLIINIYQCFFALNILFDEVERGLGHEKKKKHFATFHLHHFLKKTITNDLN